MTSGDAEARFRSVFEGALDAMLIVDDDARIVDGNASALSLLDVGREGLLSMTVGDLAPPEFQSDLDAWWNKFLLDGRMEGQFALQRAGGETRAIDFRATARIMPGRHLSVLRDITKRVRAEKAHQAAQRDAEKARSQLAAVLENIPDYVVAVDASGTIQFVNRAVPFNAGKQAIGSNWLDLFPTEQHPVMTAALEAVLAGGSPTKFETCLTAPDGSSIWFECGIGAERRGDEIVGAVIIARDVAEKKRTETRLAMTDRLVSVGTLAAGVAHEINNPLTTVIANLDLMAQDLARLALPAYKKRTRGAADSLIAEFRESLDDTRAAAWRICHIVRDLKVFSRPDERRRGPVDINRVMESTLRMAANEIRHRARLVKEYGDVPPVDGSESKFGQVCLNLIVNAAQAIREGDAAHNTIRVATRVDGDGRVAIEVSDTGAGIPARALARIFEPFYTTKPVGVGMGLGLAICHGIVAGLGGEIQVESVVGAGSTFRVLLPPADLSQVVEPNAPAPVARCCRRARVCVIDDEPSICVLLRRALAEEHEVVTANEAGEALARIRGGEVFDVILCDLLMPQMTGMEFHDELRRLDPLQAARIVFLTGGAFTPAARSFLEAMPHPHIEKPFDPRQILALVNGRIR
ncbi:PAS domain S-box protein [bacterium]|nr:PAS domain S-box protein [bacterium]